MDSKINLEGIVVIQKKTVDQPTYTQHIQPEKAQ